MGLKFDKYQLNRQILDIIGWNILVHVAETNTIFRSHQRDSIRLNFNWNKILICARLSGLCCPLALNTKYSIIRTRVTGSKENR